MPRPRLPAGSRLRPRSTSTLGWLGRAALLAGVALAARTALRTRRELADWRRADERLRTDPVEVPSIDGVRRLRLHARVVAPVRSTYPPIVLLHGYGLSGRYLVPLAARLGRHAPVHVPDLPGHGDSEPDARPLDVPELAGALGAYLDAQGLRGAIVVAHSLGAAIAATLAARRPELVAGLVLVGPASDPAQRAKPGLQLRRGLVGALHERPSFAWWAAGDLRRAAPGVLATELRALNEYRIEDVLPEVRAPVRVIRGEHDELIPQRWAEAVARLADAPAPTVIPGWGHAVNYDAPDALVKAVFGFVRELRAAAAAAPVSRAGGPAKDDAEDVDDTAGERAVAARASGRDASSGDPRPVLH